jgi:hypothetical protein
MQKEWGEFVSVQLDEEEMAAFTAALALGDDFFEMDDDFDMVPVTDLPSYQISAWDEDGERHRVWVYALEYWLEHGDEHEDLGQPPAEFVRLYELMRDFEHADLEEWRPEKFEVMLWPYEVSEATPWPPDWPGLDDPATVERHEDNYSLFLDDDEYWEDFQELGGPGKTYRLDGRTFTSSLRYPLPGEGWWMRLDED